MILLGILDLCPTLTTYSLGLTPVTLQLRIQWKQNTQRNNVRGILHVATCA